MTFKDVLYKNFRAHARRYLSFFLCSSFTIMVFFMYSAIYFNNGINNTLKSNTKDILNATIISIILFSIIFLSYAYTSFSRSRKKELGLFMILGMSNGIIKKMLCIENIMIAVASLLTGLLAGSVFSRLFFMIVVELLNLGDIRFQFNILCYISTVAVFASEFTIIIILSSVIASRVEIIDSFKSARTTEKDYFNSPLIGIAGLCVLVFSFVLKYMDTIDIVHVKEMSSVFVIICFTGLYFSVSQFGNVLTSLFKRNKRLYYSNLPGISTIKHKIYRNKTVLFLIAMLSAITVYFIGSAFSTLQQASVIAENQQPYHLAYIENENTGRIPEQELEQIINSGGIKPVKQKKLEFIEAGIATNYGYNLKVTVLSDKNFNLLGENQLRVENSKYIMVCPDDMTQSAVNSLKFDECRLDTGSGEFRFKLKRQISGQPLNRIKYLNLIFIIISETDYGIMKKSVEPSHIGYLRLIHYPDWHKTSDISNKLENELSIAENQSDYESHEYGDFPLLGSRIAAYEKIRNEGSLLLFLTTFLGALFFISSASIIYFKLFSEIDEEREKFKKFFYIGIREKEYVKYISTELKIIFFLPLIIGIILAFAYTVIDLKYSSFRLDSLVDLVLVTLGYLTFEAAFYIIAKKRYSNEIMDPSCRTSVI